MEDLETQILYITNVPNDITKEQILKMFSKYGTVVQVRIGNRPDTAGSIFVIFQTIDSAVLAFQNMNGFYYKKKYMKIKFYQPFFKAYSNNS